nr:MAG TPA: hypothetical protein [Caudoviricetes sp.]
MICYYIKLSLQHLIKKIAFLLTFLCKFRLYLH